MEVHSLSIDCRREERRILTFIRRAVTQAGAKGVVIGLSGGVDSSVAGALCVRALGPKKVLVALLPSMHTPTQDEEDAQELAKAWGVKRVNIGISQVADRIADAVGPSTSKLAMANVQARVRMTMLYYLANSCNLLVVGTGDRSEETIGFFTKYGDGGVDILPIAHLFKAQVRQMGEYLGLPIGVVGKPASPQLWPGHTAEEELPAGYETLDPLLHLMFDKGLTPAAASKRLGVNEMIAKAIMAMHKQSRHKRSLPPSLRPLPSRGYFSRTKD